MINPESRPKEIVPTGTLINAPFEAVKTVFADHQARKEGELPKFARPGAKPDFGPEPGSSSTYSPDYHVRSDFNPEQYKYVRVVRTHLNAFAQGKSIGNDTTGELAKPFAQRVVENFLVQPDNPSFTEAIIQSNLDMTEEFAQSHPNLSPALNAFYEVGSAGTTLLLLPSRILLKNDIKRQAGEKILLFDIKGLFKFTRTHSTPDELIWVFSTATHRTSEVQCAGKTLAETLYLHIVAASTILASSSDVRNKYNSEIDEEVPENAQERIRNHVSQVSRKIEYAYASGELK